MPYAQVARRGSEVPEVDAADLIDMYGNGRADGEVVRSVLLDKLREICGEHIGGGVLLGAEEHRALQEGQPKGVSDYTWNRYLLAMDLSWARAARRQEVSPVLRELFGLLASGTDADRRRQATYKEERRALAWYAEEAGLQRVDQIWVEGLVEGHPTQHTRVSRLPVSLRSACRVIEGVSGCHLGIGPEHRPSVPLVQRALFLTTESVARAGLLDDAAVSRMRHDARRFLGRYVAIYRPPDVQRRIVDLLDDPLCSPDDVRGLAEVLYCASRLAGWQIDAELRPMLQRDQDVAPLDRAVERLGVGSWKMLTAVPDHAWELPVRLQVPPLPSDLRAPKAPLLEPARNAATGGRTARSL